MQTRNLGDLYSMKQKRSQSKSWRQAAGTEHTTHKYMKIEKNVYVVTNGKKNEPTQIRVGHSSHGAQQPT